MASTADRAAYAGYTLAQLDSQYDIEKTVPDMGAYLGRYAAASALTRQRRAAHLDVRYGPGAAEALDVFLSESEAPAPIIVFIHGGGWRGSNKEARAFPADLFCRSGAVWISIEYPLAPAHRLDAMVAAVRRAVLWVQSNAASFNGDAARIVVVGNSAGGHLAAMAATTDWQAEAGLPEPPISGLVTISGVFDMRPLQLTHANSWLEMDDASVLRNSPSRHIPDKGCPLVALVGTHEPDEFRRQSIDFAADWAARGGNARSIVVPEHNHFSIIGLLGEADNPVSGALLEMIGRRHAASTDRKNHG